MASYTLLLTTLVFLLCLCATSAQYYGMGMYPGMMGGMGYGGYGMGGWGRRRHHRRRMGYGMYGGYW